MSTSDSPLNPSPKLNPLVLTINGRAEVVVQDAEAYQELLDRVEAIESGHHTLAARGTSSRDGKIDPTILAMCA